MTNFLKRAAFAVVALFLVAGPAHADGHAKKGSFVGASNHITTGTATIEKTGSGYVVRLHDDFSLDGAPDPWVSLGKGGNLNAVQVAKLKTKTGAQTYAVPAGVDISSIEQVVVYCVRFSVPLGIAAVK